MPRYLPPNRLSPARTGSFAHRDEHARAGEPGTSLSATAGKVGGPGACRSDNWRTSASDQLLAVDSQSYQSLAHRGARIVEFCSAAGVSIAFTALFLFQSQATATPASVVPSVGSAALSGNCWTGGIPLRRLLTFAPMGSAPLAPEQNPFVHQKCCPWRSG